MRTDSMIPGLPTGVSLPVAASTMRKLRGGVKFEQILVVRILQHVFEGGGPGCAAETFLHVRTRGNERFRREARRDSVW